MLDIESLARDLAQDTQQPYMAWLDALSEGKTLRSEAHLDERTFVVLAKACATPKQFALMAEAIDEYAKENPEQSGGFVLMAEFADESPFGLSEWISALEYLYDWLAQAGRVSPGLASLLGYISCCVEAAGSAPVGYPLTGMVEEMLDRYGIDSE